MSDHGHDQERENQCCCRCRGRGGFGRVVRAVLSTLFLYVVLVFGSGTLVHSHHPVAVEVGRLVQLVTFVEPAIHWAHVRGHDALASSLERLAQGVDLG